MTLPSSGPLGASDINSEAGRSSSANAPLSGSSSTPQAGSLVKLYEDSGVNQSAPHSYSEFYGKTYATLTAYASSVSSNFNGVCSEAIDQTYYHSGSGAQPTVGDFLYSDSAGNNPLANGYYKFDTNKYTRLILGNGELHGNVNTC